MNRRKTLLYTVISLRSLGQGLLPEVCSCISTSCWRQSKVDGSAAVTFIHLIVSVTMVHRACRKSPSWFFRLGVPTVSLPSSELKNRRLRVQSRAVGGNVAFRGTVFARFYRWMELEAAAEAQGAGRTPRFPAACKTAEQGGETILDLAIEDHDVGLGGRHLFTFVKRNER